MKRISWILAMSISLIIGTVAGLYLYHPTDSNATFQISDQTVRYVNESLLKMVRKDSKTFLKINNTLNASPYLKAQKKAFLAKYYGHKSAANHAQAERLMRLYEVSQQSKIVTK